MVKYNLFPVSITLHADTDQMKESLVAFARKSFSQYGLVLVPDTEGFKVVQANPTLESYDQALARLVGIKNN